jgi:hypothetical protein
MKAAGIKADIVGQLKRLPPNQTFEELSDSILRIENVELASKHLSTIQIEQLSICFSILRHTIVFWDWRCNPPNIWNGTSCVDAANMSTSRPQSISLSELKEALGSAIKTAAERHYVAVSSELSVAMLPGSTGTFIGTTTEQTSASVKQLSDMTAEVAKSVTGTITLPGPEAFLIYRGGEDGGWWPRGPGPIWFGIWFQSADFTL